MSEGTAVLYSPVWLESRRIRVGDTVLAHFNLGGNRRATVVRLNALTCDVRLPSGSVVQRRLRDVERA